MDLKYRVTFVFAEQKNATVAFEVVLYPNTTVANYVWSLFSARSGLTLRTLVKFGRAGGDPSQGLPVSTLHKGSRAQNSGIDPSQGVPRTKL